MGDIQDTAQCSVHNVSSCFNARPSQYPFSGQWLFQSHCTCTLIILLYSKSVIILGHSSPSPRPLQKLKFEFNQRRAVD